jgi:hypothetical protein
MIKNITKDNIRELLNGFTAAIELDQIRVDALPASVFHRDYDDGMWRRHRREHLEYVKQLLPTLDTIPPVILEKLTRIASHCEPAIVRDRALGLFALVSSGNYDAEEFTTAAQFFEELIEELVWNQCEGGLIGEDAPALMMRWLPATDPLRIAQDPECGYGSHLGAFHG